MRPTSIIVEASCIISILSCAPADDLGRAIEAGTGRTVTGPTITPTAIDWLDLRAAQSANDSIALRPEGVCFAGDRLLVADSGPQRVYQVDLDGNLVAAFGAEGEGPGEFRRMSALACSTDGHLVLVADPGLGRVTFFSVDPSGKARYLGDERGPRMPQGIPYYGVFAVADNGDWLHSWLGSKVGPYLEHPAWDDTRVIERRSRNADRVIQFGEAFDFSDPVLMRVFNETDLAFRRDTLWVLHQAPATVVAYASDGSPTPDTLRLPIYHRGIEPIIELGDGALESGYRRNRAHYYPNVAQIATVGEELFATIRLRGFQQLRRKTQAGEYTEFWPSSSSVELFTGAGEVVADFPFPGYGQLLAAGSGWIAVVTEEFETGRKDVLLGRVPEELGPLMASGQR